MVMVKRLSAILRAKNLCAEEVGQRARLGRTYFCEVENGEITPSLAAWERIASALEAPLATLFYDGESPPHLPNLPARKTADDIAGVSGVFLED